MSRINELKAAEYAIAERTAGLSIATLEDANFPKVGLLGAIGWVLAKRENATLSYNEYMETRTLEEIMDELGLSDEDEEGN